MPKGAKEKEKERGWGVWVKGNENIGKKLNKKTKYSQKLK
jgi:hypothetical protein